MVRIKSSIVLARTINSGSLIITSASTDLFALPVDFDHPVQVLYCDTSNIDEMLVHCGKRGAKKGRLGHVVKPDNGQILRDPPARGKDGPHGPQGNLIAGCKHGVDIRLLPQKLMHGLLAPCSRPVTFNHQGWRGFQTGLVQGAFPAQGIAHALPTISAVL